MRRALVIGIITAALAGSAVFAFGQGYLDKPLQRCFPDCQLFR